MTLGGADRPRAEQLVKLVEPVGKRQRADWEAICCRAARLICNSGETREAILILETLAAQPEELGPG